MSHQGCEGWFPECLVCGSGNLGPIVCLDPTCHEHAGLRTIKATDQRLVLRGGHWWKLCQLCERPVLSDAGAWGTFALCVGCWNTFALADVYPPPTPSQLILAMEQGEITRRPEITVRKK